MLHELVSTDRHGHRRPARWTRVVTSGCLIALLGMAAVVNSPSARADTPQPEPIAVAAENVADPVAISGPAVSGTAISGSAISLATHLLSLVYPSVILQGLALTVVPVDQLWAFNQIISHESSWNVFAVNPSSGAYGLPQALPAWKMGSEAPDWLFNPLTQIRWAYKYMNDRYGSPNAAWDFWQEHHWY